MGADTDTMPSDDPEREETQKDPKRLVLVVHGIGDQTPGSTLETFVKSLLAFAGSQLQALTEVLWLREDDGNAREIATFPVHLHRVESGQGKTVFAEVFWADLSRVGAGLIGVLRGLYDLIFGLPHIAREAAGERKWLRRVGALVASFLKGPIAAYNVLLALVVVVVLLVNLLYGLDKGQGVLADHGKAGILIIISGGLAMALSLGLLLSLRLRSKTFLASLAGCGLITVLFPLGSRFLRGSWYDSWVTLRMTEGAGDGPVRGMAWYAAALVDFFSLLWILLTVIMSIYLISWAVTWVRTDKTHRPAVNISFVSTAFIVGLWGMVIPTFWIMAARGVSEEWTLPQASMLLKEGVKLIGMQWLIAVLFLSAAAITAAQRWSWTRQTKRRGFDPSRPAPRLLLSPLLQTVTIATTLAAVAITFFMAAAVFRLTLASAPIVGGVLGFLDAGNEIAILAASFMVSIIVVSGNVLLPFLRTGLDLAQDVITHFRCEVCDGKDYLRRERIKNRFRQVLYHLSEREKPSELIVVSHSQGTIISLETLAEERADSPVKGLRKTLVTMGSPFTHLYQEYFPAEYPSLDDPKWKLLRPHGKLKGPLERWTNIYRMDDFVGTFINPSKTWPKNVPVAAKGHNDYWIDCEVLEALHQEVKELFPTQGGRSG